MAHDDMPPAQKPKSHKAGKLLKLLFVFVILAALAGAGWYFWQQSKPTETAEQTQQAIADLDKFRFGSVEGPADSYFPNPVSSGVSIGQSRQMYEGLVGNEDRKYVPLLAESWTNPDQRTWVFKLRQNVKFQTGNIMTAADVKASLEAEKDMDFWKLFVSTIQSIEVVNDQEVKIVTMEPDALLLNRLTLAFIYDTSATDKTGNNGTGAYEVDQSKENNENYLALKPFDDYHGGRPKTRYVEYKIFPKEDDIIAAMENNEIDYTEILVNPEHDKKLKDAGFVAESFYVPGVFGMYLNIGRSEDSPLQNKEVRKAIALAVDRQDLINQLKNDSTPAAQVVPDSLPGYDAKISYPEHNTELAKQTLLAAYPEGVTLEFPYFEGVQADPPILIEQLRAAGFTIDAQPTTDPVALTKTLEDGNYDLFTGSYNSDIFDSRDILGAIYGKDSDYATNSDSAYEKLLSDSDTEFDPTKRIAILQAANQYLADSYLWIPVRKTQYLAYHRSDLSFTVDYEGGANLGFFYWKLGRKVQ